MNISKHNLDQIMILVFFAFSLRQTICVYKNNKIEELEKIDRGIFDPNNNIKEKNKFYEQLLDYVEILPNTMLKKIEFNLPLINNQFSERYKPSNPSIIKTNDGYMMICRTVNYSLINTRYKLLAYDTKFNSRNFLLFYDINLNIISQHEIIDDTDTQRYESKNLGLEDCRIFQRNNNYWFSCTSYDTNPQGIPQIALCRLPKDLTTSEINISRLILLKGPELNKPEKNWLPFVFDNELLMIYSYNPLLILKPKNINGNCITKCSKHLTLDLTTLRGSAGPIKFDEGYLVMTHELLKRNLSHKLRNDKKYFHRFLFLNKNLILTKISKPFVFKHLGVEFCCSMTLDHDNKNLIMPIGIEDNEAYLCSIDVNHIKDLLEPIEKENDVYHQASNYNFLFDYFKR